MKSVIIFGKKDARIVEREIPKIGSNEILVKMNMCGICGTDVEKYLGNFSTPPILGHEPVGIVEEIGKEISFVNVGDRVYVHHHVPCRICYYCLNGDFTMCDSFTKVNLDPCGLSEYFRVPSEIVSKGGVFKLSDKITNEKGIFIEPLACCIRAINKLSIKFSDKVLILGLGPAGYLFLLLLKSLGIANIACADVNEKRLNFAKRYTMNLFNFSNELDKKEVIDWSKIGPDIVIVATSNVKAINDSIELVRKGGKICIFGNPKRGELIGVEAAKIFLKETKIIPSYSTTEFEITQSIYLLENGLINPEELITHKYSLENAIEALEVAEKGDSIKVAVYSN